MAQENTTADMSDVPRTLVECFNKRDMEKALTLLSDQVEWMDIARQTLYRGKNGYLQYDQSWLRAFPDGKVEIINIIASGERVVVEYVGRGTHLGPLEGPEGVIQATGKCVQLPMIDVIRVQNGKVIRGRTYYNAASLLQQVMEAPEDRAA